MPKLRPLMHKAGVSGCWRDRTIPRYSPLQVNETPFANNAPNRLRHFRKSRTPQVQKPSLCNRLLPLWPDRHSIAGRMPFPSYHAIGRLEHRAFILFLRAAVSGWIRIVDAKLWPHSFGLSRAKSLHQNAICCANLRRKPALVARYCAKVGLLGQTLTKTRYKSGNFFNTGNHNIPTRNIRRHPNLTEKARWAQDGFLCGLSDPSSAKCHSNQGILSPARQMKYCGGNGSGLGPRTS